MKIIYWRINGTFKTDVRQEYEQGTWMDCYAQKRLQQWSNL